MPPFAKSAKDGAPATEERVLMFAGVQLVVVVVATVFAAAGNWAFFYMQRKVADVGYQPKFLKFPWDFNEVRSLYRRRIDAGEVPKWPVRLYQVSTIGIVMCALYMVYWAVRFARH